MLKRSKHAGDPNNVRVAVRLPLTRRQWVKIILGGVITVLLVVPPVTYVIWQAQARALVEALSNDVALSDISENVPESLVDVRQDENADKNVEESIPKKPVVVPSDGTLRIKGANIEMPMFKSSDGRVLYNGAWVPAGSVSPGEIGNAVILGHRFLNLPPSKNTMFNLHKVNVGDVIEVEWEGIEYKYKVTDSIVVPPSEVSVMSPTPTATITLITCTPIFSTKNRLVIKASLIN